MDGNAEAMKLAIAYHAQAIPLTEFRQRFVRAWVDDPAALRSDSLTADLEGMYAELIHGIVNEGEFRFRVGQRIYGGQTSTVGNVGAVTLRTARHGEHGQ